jgi:hypothetical protein
VLSEQPNDSEEFSMPSHCQCVAPQS